MAVRTVGRTPEVVAAEAKRQREEAANYEKEKFAKLLAMEQVAYQLAEGYPDSPNCDAVKSALTNAGHGIAHIRKALENNARLA